MSYDVHALRAREFPWAERNESIYLDHASTGPIPERSRAMLRTYGDRRAEPFRLTAEDGFPSLATARERVASLIGAKVSTIAMMTNTSHGVNLAARALPYGPGDVVLSTHGEFPANVYPWEAAVRARGAEHRLLPLAGDLPDEGALMRAIETDARVKVVALSWVSYWSGYRCDLATIGEACRARGIALYVDAIQGVGPLALDVITANVDVLSCGAQKWLCSPWGTGFAYVREGWLDRLEPAEIGWLAQPANADFERFLQYDSTLYADARRFEVMTADYVSFAAMAESVGLLLELGPANAAAHVRMLADRAVAFADATPAVTLVTPANPACRAGVLAFRVADADTTSARLRAAKVAHSVREGCIRFAPHFYNTVDELDTALALLAR